MRIEAILTKQDVAELLQRFVPLEIELGQVGSGERVLTVDELAGVTLVPETGVRVQCSGHLRWPVLGVSVSTHVRGVAIVIKPSVQLRDGHEALVFRLAIEEADIAWLPASIDRTIAEKVNRDLTDNDIELAWNFPRTLSHVFALPEALRSAAALGLEVVAGRVRVTDSSLGLSVAFRAWVDRR
ncbi:MAG TPA: hypothetical protein VIF15_15100, partial [Polyangiaceae bacterium]